ncbi:ABC transporter permease [Nocardioides sp. AE5]|uniref:ABC transporter permease n=1 Tax=Nocardioides sp. AE5 TaxID=2962573 RepID=UPI002881BAA0|nr:ABC transporter permease [Nocardioides sp. AE5]MDT0203706.1 ABC transporter permease [Nocardioides sp. AE5]
MTAALKYEWMRLTTLRSTWWISGLAVLVGAGFTFIAAMSIRLSSPTEVSGTVDEDWSRFFLEAGMTQFSNVDPFPYLLAYAVAVLGILSWGHEYRHGMIRATLTAVPNRTAVWSAKFITVAGFVAVVAIVSCLISLVLTLLWFGGLDFQYDWLALLLAIFKRVVYTILVTWLVMAVTVLIRHQTFSLVLLYLWPLGVETLLRGLLAVFSGLTGSDDLYDLSRFLPFNAGGRIMQNWNGEFDENLDLFGEPLSALGGFLVFGLVVGVLVGASLAVFNKRDA